MSETTAPIETPQLLLDHHLRTLRLPTMLREYDRVARQCAAEDLDYPRYLLHMAELELLDRERRATERRIRQAKFPVTKSLESFDFLAMPTLNKAMVLELSRCEFLTRRENILLLGNRGTGKTHIALALGLAACQQGHRVRFTTAAALVHELIEARDERKLLRFQKQIASYELLIVDELGFVPLSKTGAELLFEMLTKLYLPPGKAKYQALKAITGGTINLKAIRTHWNDILRLATSIKQGTVTASLMLRKLGSYPRQNGLAVALRELGRIERTLFILSWLQSVDLRRRVHAGLNKGEARNALARAVFLCRLGEIRDRSFEQQRYRASGLTLVTAAIALWNTVYIERAVLAFASDGRTVDPALLKYLSPLGWEHINLTGDYQWNGKRPAQGRFRSLRTPNRP